MTTWFETIKSLNLCDEAMDWLEQQPDVETAWNQCERGDWLLWLAARAGVNRKLLVTAVCDCAEPALQYVPEGDDRPRIAIETARRWTRGEATLDEVKIAADAAADAAYTTTYAAYTAYTAAYTAAYTVADATYAAYAATDAAYAATYSAYTTYAAARATDAAARATDAAARAVSLKQSADIVRSVITLETVLDALNKI